MSLSTTLLRIFVWLFAATTAWASGPLRRQTKTKSNLTDTARIIGGTAASAGQYPFFVQWSGCGAVLIHPDVILSAAHCNVLTSNTVIVGSNTYGSTTGGTSKSITKRVQHPSFNSSTMVNDFLVMKLDSTVTQKPIVMNNNPNYPATDQVLTVIGFGSTVIGGSMTSTLQQVNVNYVPQSTCNVEYPNQIDSTTMLCAGVTNGGKDSCQGDSGGPIFDLSGMLVGSVSWGNSCALAGYPGVYSRTSGGYSWINQQICSLSSVPPAWCTTTNSTQPTAAPVQPTAAPVKPTSAPVQPTSAPIQPTSAPIQPTSAPVQPTSAPVKPTVAPAQPTPAPVQPTTAPCRDSANTFLVDSVTGTQGCSWLSINLSRYGYLCKFIDVGRACQVTCSLCGVFV